MYEIKDEKERIRLANETCIPKTEQDLSRYIGKGVYRSRTSIDSKIGAKYEFIKIDSIEDVKWCLRTGFLFF